MMDPQTMYIAGSAESEDKAVGTSPNCGASICMSPSIPRGVSREMSQVSVKES